MDRAGIIPEFPDCTAKYMIDFLFEVGPWNDGAAITHAEIESWKRNTGVELSFWEAWMLHRLSREYVGQSRKSVIKDCPAPYQMRIEDQRELVESKFRAFLSQSKVSRE